MDVDAAPAGTAKSDGGWGDLATSPAGQISTKLKQLLSDIGGATKKHLK